MSPKYEWSIVLLTATQTHTQLARKMAIADGGSVLFRGLLGHDLNQLHSDLGRLVAAEHIADKLGFDLQVHLVEFV